MNPQRKHNPVRENSKIFLAGRVAHVEWVDSDEPAGEYDILFANAGWVRMRPVQGGEETEFVTPASNIWRIRAPRV